MEERLCDPAGEVCGRSVDLGIVLAGESTTTMCTPTAIGVDDDLTASQTSITLWATNDEEARWLDLCVLACDCVSGGIYSRGTWSSHQDTWLG